MSEATDATDVDARVRTFLDRYAAPNACAAQLLCDRHDPAAVAYTIVSPDGAAQDLTYGALRRESERLAQALAGLGIGAGDRVATLMGKSRAFLVTVMAIWRLGAVHVPLFTAFAPPAIALRLNASRCRLVACDAGQQAKLAPSAAIPAAPPWRVLTVGAGEPGDLSYDDLLASAAPGMPAAAVGGEAPLIQIYTSGTTGAPKGVVVPLRALACIQAYAEFAFDLRPSDLFWNAADPGWAYGLYAGVLSAFTTGVPSLLLEGGFSAETTLAVLERFGVTNFAAAPTVYRSLRGSGLAPAGPFRLRCASSAGEPLTPEVNDWARTVLGVEVHDHYGQTETSMLINNHHDPALKRPLKPGSMGQVMPGWTAVILQTDADTPAAVGEPGRLALDLPASPLAWFAGYVDEPVKSADKFSADGRWYITGDVASVDAQGYFSFQARDDDLIIMAGYRIGPFEVESVILTHPAVTECAVVAAADQVRGEVLEAVVVLRDGHAASDALTAEIQARVKTGFAAHAYPRHVHYAASLPKTASGKIQRFALRQRIRDARAAGGEPDFR